MIRIVTYNLRGGLGMDGVRSLSRIAQVLRPLAADIICLQELHCCTWNAGRENQPNRLARSLARHMLFQATRRYPLGGTYGIGIAVRHTVEAVREHALPGDTEPRGALEVRLRNLNGLRRLTVFCTHWGLTPAGRAQQASVLAQIAREAPRPLLIAGDFNAPPDDPAVRHLRECVNLQDADAQQNRPTFVADRPTVRIDLILHSNDLMPAHVEVIPTQASDHLPVMADLRPVAQQHPPE
ncbi:MAG: endonuclease/exonuclease/phosphatase family protein [Chloroherpetonaceae bacterium]|nr:endonuclease/exonuclease/phosphatase family protein [Chloroherpetonaceae bacterium]